LTVYADTSFFVSIYVEDRHSTVAEQLVNSGPLIWFTPLHYAEWTHAIAQQVFHKKMSAAEAQQTYRLLEKDRAVGLWVESAMPEGAFDICADLARRHGSRLGLRTLDSLHVATALQLKTEQFWTFDERQAKLARAEGLKTALSV
jgi:predicted nucleic acid-binding protein